jgi:hypothetical protein
MTVAYNGTELITTVIAKFSIVTVINSVMFANVNHIDCSLIFVSKAGAYPSGAAYGARKGVERTYRNEHSSLLEHRVHYDRKSFIVIAPRPF